MKKGIHEIEEKAQLVDGLDRFVDLIVRNAIADPEKYRAREMEIAEARKALLEALARLGSVAECAAGG